jgi:hypothetical protein
MGEGMTNQRDSRIKLYRAADAPPKSLVGEAVGVLGYGNLGRTAALNLRDSGVKVRVGNREDEYADRAREERVRSRAAGRGGFGRHRLRAPPRRGDPGGLHPGNCSRAAARERDFPRSTWPGR